MTISGFIAYAIQTWKNKPDTSTPLSAARLAHIEAGIKANSDAITKLAAAVINQQANDVNKIPSSALMYSVNEKVDSAISDLSGKGIVFERSPADQLNGRDTFVFSEANVDTSDKTTYSPLIGVYPQWYNVLTYGTALRCTQIAITAYDTGGIPRGTIFVRTQHDSVISGWSRYVTSSDLAMVGNVNGMEFGTDGEKRYFVFKHSDGSKSSLEFYNNGINLVRYNPQTAQWEIIWSIPVPVK